MMKNFLTNDREFRFNEIVFANRNKEYGAYTLRSDESNILKKATAIGVAAFLAISLTPIVLNSFKDSSTIVGRTPVKITLVDVNHPDKPTKQIKPTTPNIQKQVKTIDTRVPEPKHEVTIEKPAVSVGKYDGAIAGTKDADGGKPTLNLKSTIDIVVDKPHVPAPSIPDNNPKTVVDVEANFADGIESFRNKVAQNFDTSDFEGTGEMLNTTITFIVEKDGTISQIKSSGADSKFNAEAEKTIRAIKGKWIPAKIKGESVRSYFKFPISMKFE